MIQIHVAHHGAHAGNRQLHDAADQIVHLVNRLDGIGDLPVDDRVDMDGHVVARDHRLRRQIDVLFAQIDRGHAAARVGPIDGARLVDERHEDIQAAGGDATESPQPLNQHHGCLRHNLNRLGRDNQQHYADEEKGRRSIEGRPALHHLAEESSTQTSLAHLQPS